MPSHNKDFFYFLKKFPSWLRYKIVYLYLHLRQKKVSLKSIGDILLFNDFLKKIANYFSYLYSRCLLPFSYVRRFASNFLYFILPIQLGTLVQFEPIRFNRYDFNNEENGDNELSILIVTPSFNQSLYIGRTIDSVMSQNYLNLKYIIQDNSSFDGTHSILNQYEFDNLQINIEKDNGQSHAINLGFTKGDGEIMAWLNSDDILLPGALNTVSKFFQSHPDVDVIYGNRILIDENDCMIGEWRLPEHCDDVIEWADFIPQETLFWRRRIWERAGGFVDESFNFAMDWDLLLRFRACGAKFVHIPLFLGAFRIHSSQKTLSQIQSQGIDEMSRIRKMVHGFCPSENLVAKKIKPYILKHRIELAFTRLVKIIIPYFKIGV
jgi:carbamoyltransferase